MLERVLLSFRVAVQSVMLVELRQRATAGRLTSRTSACFVKASHTRVVKL